jgi:hypothetical protein
MASSGSGAITLRLAHPVAYQLGRDAALVVLDDDCRNVD